MTTSARSSCIVLSLLAGCAVAANVAAQEPGDWHNATAGGPLRPGVYGRIVVQGQVAPPPVIFKHPVVADGLPLPPNTKPVYLYVPPGQVRKWRQNCAKWAACEQPVLFVRVDDSPSRWGRWRLLRERDREDYALHVRD